MKKLAALCLAGAALAVASPAYAESGLGGALDPAPVTQAEVPAVTEAQPIADAAAVVEAAAVPIEDVVEPSAPAVPASPEPVEAAVPAESATDVQPVAGTPADVHSESAARDGAPAGAPDAPSPIKDVAGMADDPLADVVAPVVDTAAPVVRAARERTEPNVAQPIGELLERLLGAASLVSASLEHVLEPLPEPTAGSVPESRIDLHLQLDLLTTTDPALADPPATSAIEISAGLGPTERAMPGAGADSTVVLMRSHSTERPPVSAAPTGPAAAADALAEGPPRGAEKDSPVGAHLDGAPTPAAHGISPQLAAGATWVACAAVLLALAAFAAILQPRRLAPVPSSLLTSSLERPG